MAGGGRIMRVHYQHALSVGETLIGLPRAAFDPVV